jgi:uncharacterized protein YqeY
MTSIRIRPYLNHAVENAVRANDLLHRDTFRMVQNAIYLTEKHLGRFLSEAEIFEVIFREIHARRDLETSFRQKRKIAMANRQAAEIIVLEELLPEGLPSKEMDVLLATAIAELGADSPRDTRRVMCHLTPTLLGRADLKSFGAMAYRYLTEIKNSESFMLLNLPSSKARIVKPAAQALLEEVLRDFSLRSHRLTFGEIALVVAGVKPAAFIESDLEMLNHLIRRLRVSGVQIAGWTETRSEKKIQVHTVMLDGIDQRLIVRPGAEEISEKALLAEFQALVRRRYEELSWVDHRRFGELLGYPRTSIIANYEGRAATPKYWTANERRLLFCTHGQRNEEGIEALNWTHQMLGALQAAYGLDFIKLLPVANYNQ